MTISDWSDEGGATPTGPATHIPSGTSDVPPTPGAPGQPNQPGQPGRQEIDHAHVLVDLADSALTLSPEEVDIRSFTVVDRDREEIGTVDSLIIDEQERRIRLLRVGKGGVLGWGRSQRLVPVAAVTLVEPTGKVVRIDTTREVVSASPEYDPDLQEENRDYSPYLAWGVDPVTGMRGPLPPV